MKLKRLKQMVPVMGLSAYLALGVVSANAMSPEMRKEANKEWRAELHTVKKATNPAVMNGEISSISGTTLMIVKEGKTYTVNVDASTVFIRKFGGQASIAEFSIGDMVNVRGAFSNDAKTVVNAKLIRDTSIYKRQANISGVWNSK